MADEVQLTPEQQAQFQAATTQTPAQPAATQVALTPEQQAQYRQATGEIDPLADLNPQQIADFAVKVPTFDIASEAAKRNTSGNPLTPAQVDNAAEAMDKLRIRGTTASDVVQGIKQAPSALLGMVKGGWNYLTRSIDAASKGAAGQIYGDTDMQNQAAREAAEVESASESGTVGLGKMLMHGGQKVADLFRTTPRTDDEKRQHFFNEVALAQQQQAIQQGKGAALQGLESEIQKEAQVLTPADVRAGAAEAQAQTPSLAPTPVTQEAAQAGSPVRPEEVATMTGGDPLTLWAFGKGMEGVSAATPNVVKQIAARASQAGVNAAQKAAGAVISAVPKVATTVEPITKIFPAAGAVVGGVKGAAEMEHGGPLVGIPAGYLAGEKIAKLVKGGVESLQPLAKLGSEVAGTTPVSGNVSQLIRDAVASVPEGAASIGKGAALDLGMAATAESPEEGRQAGMGTALGILGAGLGTGRRIVSGQLIAPRYQTAFPVANTGNFPALDALHNTEYAKLNPGQKNSVNATRQLAQGVADVFVSRDPEATKQALVSSGVSEASADNLSKSGGFFSADLPDRTGTKRRVIVIQDPGQGPHEAIHALDNVMGENANRLFDQKVLDSIRPNIDQWGDYYAQRLNGGPLPEGQTWQQYVLRRSGWAREQAANKLGEQATDALRSRFGEDPYPQELKQIVSDELASRMELEQSKDPGASTDDLTDRVTNSILTPEEQNEVAERYLAREIKAEAGNALFQAGGKGFKGPSGVLPALARVVAGIQSVFGGEPLAGRTSPLGFPLQYDLTKAVGEQATKGLEQAGAVAPGESPSKPATVIPRQTGAIPVTQDQKDDAATQARDIAAAAPDAPLPGATKTQRELLGTVAEAIAGQNGVKLNYLSAPDEPAAATTSNRNTRRAIIESFRNMPQSARALWEKTFFPERVLQTKQGYQVLGWAPEVFASNAHKLAQTLSDLQAKGTSVQSPYELDVNNRTFTPQGWQDLYTDTQKFVKNQGAGRTGSGEPLVVPKELEGYNAPPVSRGAGALDQRKADFINMLYNFKLPETPRITKGKIPLNIAGQEVSAATMPGRVELPVRPRGEYAGEPAQALGIEGRAIAETNPFRNEVEEAAGKAGVPLPSMIEAVQRLNLNNIKEAEVAPEVPEFRGNTLSLTAGFSPMSDGEWFPKAGTPGYETPQPETERQLAPRNVTAHYWLSPNGGMYDAQNYHWKWARKHVVGDAADAVQRMQRNGWIRVNADGTEQADGIYIEGPKPNAAQRKALETLGFKREQAILDDSGRIAIPSTEDFYRASQFSPKVQADPEHSWLDPQGTFHPGYRDHAYAATLITGIKNPGEAYASLLGNGWKRVRREGNTLWASGQGPEPLTRAQQAALQNAGMALDVTVKHDIHTGAPRTVFAPPDFVGGQFSPNDDPRAVKEAALRTPNGRLYTGLIHAEAFQKALDEGWQFPQLKEGFVTNAGEFLDRPQAYKRAQELKQVRAGEAETFEGNKRLEALGLYHEKSMTEIRDALREATGEEPYEQDVQDIFNRTRQFSPQLENLADVPMDDLKNYKGKYGGGGTGWAWDLGSKAKTPEDLQAMLRAREVLGDLRKDALSTGNLPKAMEYGNKASFAREAYEAATGHKIGLPGEPGSAVDGIRRDYDPNYQPPMAPTITRPSANIRPIEEPVGQFTPPAERLRNPKAEEISQRYAEKVGLPQPKLTNNRPLPIRLMQDLGDYFEDNPHAPNDPAVKASYNVFRNEIVQQAHDILDSGLKVEPWEKPGEPYVNSRAMVEDITKNNHLYFLKTKGGFGGSPAGGEVSDVAKNNLMTEPTDIKIGGHTLDLNEVTRWVHDYLGHSAEGNEFGPRGEYNAFLKHSQLFTPEAQKALMAELLMQAGWFFGGRHVRRADRTIPVKGEPDYVPPQYRTFIEPKNLIPSDDLMKQVLDKVNEVKNAPSAQFAFAPPRYDEIRKRNLETRAADEAKSRTFIVRHGTTEMNNADPDKDRIRGHKDVPLNEQGREEAEQTAEDLSKYGIRHIVTSDLSRAADTAQAIAEKTGATVREDEGLRPWKFGPTIEGKPTTDMLPKIKTLTENPDERPPGGESFNEFKARFLDAFKRALDENKTQNTAIVTHYRGTKLLEAWRKTGVDNDTIDKAVFERYDKDKKPGFFDVIDKTGAAAEPPVQFSPQRKKKTEPGDIDVENTDYSKYNVTARPQDQNQWSLKPSTTGVSKAWILPNNQPVQLGGQWHHEWLNENPDVREKYGLPMTESGEENRVDALKKGFARVNYTSTGGNLTVEARAKDWRRLKPAIENLFENNIGKIDRANIHLTDEGANRSVKSDSQSFVGEPRDTKMSKAFDMISQFSPEGENELFPETKEGPKFVERSDIAKMTPEQLGVAYPEAVIPKKKDEVIPADIQDSPLAKQAGSRDAAVSAYADKLVDEANRFKDDPIYQLGLKWYDDFTPALKKEFGNDAQLFAELLAATSPRTNVGVNFGYAYDALKSFQAGRFNKILPKFEQGLEKIQDGSWERWIKSEIKKGNVEDPPVKPNEATFLAHWINKFDLKPKQSNGKLYGLHSVPVLQVFARRWLDLATGPKTRNFVGNLIGTNHEATIDMWAERTMRRLGYEPFQERWRILPGNIAPMTDADFEFSQEAFREAAKRLGVKPSALQAGLWFAEKKVWHDRGWVPMDLGSFEKELAKLPQLQERFEKNVSSEKGAKKAQSVLPLEARKLK